MDGGRPIQNIKLDAEQVEARTQVTLKAANITGADSDDVAEELTAVWNGFQVAAEDTQITVSKLAAVADSSASDLDELATAMSKVASVANNMGVDIDQLTAQIATIIATTRQAPETVGNALKTIYARINDIAAGTDDADISLGNYTEKMASLGVNVLDSNGKLRDTGDVMTEIGQKWNTMTNEQQVYLAQTMAGQRQMNNLISLFDNWDMYVEELNVSQSANNELNEKQAIYLESTAAHLQELQTQTQRTYDILFDTDTANGFIDILDGVLTKFNDWIEGLGGGAAALANLGAIATQVFNKQIAAGFQNAQKSFQVWKNNMAAAEAKQYQAEQQVAQVNIASVGKGQVSTEGVKVQVELAKQLLAVQQGITQEDQAQYIEIQKQAGAVATYIEQLRGYEQIVKEAFGKEDYINSSTPLAALEESYQIQLQTVKNIQKEQLNLSNIYRSKDEVLTKNANILTLINRLQNNYKNSLSESQQEALKWAEKQLKLKQDEAIGEEQRQIINNSIKAIYTQQEGTLEKMVLAMQLKKGLNQGDLNTQEEILDSLKQQAKQITNRGSATLKIEKNVKNVGAAFQVASAAAGSLKTFLDQTATAAQKANSTISLISAGIGGVASIIGGPMAGMLATTLAQTFGSLFEPLIEDAFKTTQEKLQQAQEALSQAASTEKTYQDSISAVQELADRYDQLSKKAGQYDITIQNLTDSEREEYNDLKQKLVSYNDEILLAYNDRGEAILKNNDNIQQTIDKLKEQRDLQQEIAYSEASKNYTSAKNNQYSEARRDAVSSQQKEDNEPIQARVELGNFLDEVRTTSLDEDQLEAYRELRSLQTDAIEDLTVISDNKDTIVALVRKIATQRQTVQLDQGGRFSVLGGLDTSTLADNVKKAELALQDAAQIDVNDVLNILKYDNSYSSAYKDLQNLGIQNLDTYLSAYLSGLQLGTDGDSMEAIYQIAQDFEENLWSAFNENPDLIDDVTAAADEFSTKTYSTLSQRIKGKSQSMNSLITNELSGLNQSTQQTILSALFGVSDIQFDQNGQISKYADVCTEALDAVVDSIQTRLTQSGRGVQGLNLGNLLGDFSGEQITSISGDLDDFFNHVDFSANDVTRQLEDYKDRLNLKSIITDVDTLRGALNKLASGDELDEDATAAIQSAAQKLLDNVGGLADKYPQLISDAQLLNNTWLSGTDEYQEALQRVTDALTSIQIAQANADFQDAFDELYRDSEGNEITIEAAIDTDQFFDQIDDICEADYSVTVAVESDAEQAFENITTTFDQISSAAALIGDNFTVAKTSLQQLNSTFPGILQGMQQLADGSIQLNQQVVQSAINGATTQAAVEAQSVQSKIESQAQLLRAKAAIYSQMAEAARLLANSETLTEDQKAQAIATINQGMNDIKAYNDQLQTNSQIENQATVADNAQQNAGIMAQNWADGANASAQAIYQFASNAIQNMAAVAAAADGDTSASVVAPSAISSTYSGGSSGSRTTVDQTSGFKSGADSKDYADYTSEDWEAAAETFDAMAASLEKTADEMDGMVAQMGVAAQDIADGVGNVNKGKAYTPSSGGSGKKGSGSGSGDNLKDAEQILKDLITDSDTLADILEKQADSLDRQIDDIERQIDILSGYEDKTIRKGKSDTIDLQIAAMEQEKALQEQKIELLYKQQDAQLQNIQLLSSELGLGQIQLDEQGNILNYSEIAIQYQTLYNELLRQAAAATDKEAQDTLLNQAKIAQERWKNLQSAITNFQSYGDSIDDARDKIRDLADEEEQLRIKQFKIQIDTDLDLADAKRDWNEFRKTVIDKIKDDDYVGQAEARLRDFFSYYNEQGTGIIQQLTDHVNKTRQELQKVENGDYSGVYGTNEAQALEDLKNYTDELMQNLEDVQEIAKDIHDYLMDQIDKAQEAFDDQIAVYEQIDDIIDHDMNLIQLLHGEDDYEDLENYYKLRSENYNKQLDFYRQEADMWKQQMDNAEQGTEQWKAFRDNWMSSIEDLNDAVEDAVQNLLDQYDNTINKIINNAKNSIMGGDWNKALDEWDKAKWTDDRYLDSASRATGVLDFVDEVNSAMNNQSPKVQKQLAQFLEKQVNELNSITNLRQIDLDIASKKLEVLQKQIALEDIQNNKSQMRLRRDSQGNYTYQYVADEDQTQQAQTDLRDTLEQLRLLAKEDVSDTIDEVQEKLEEFFEKAQQLSQTYYDDQEELQERLLELQEEYFGEQGYITMLGLDYNNMQTQLITATGAEFSNLLATMGNELQAFLGLSGDSENDQAVWTSIQALMGEGGALPTLFDSFVNDTILKNFNLMSEQNQNLLFGSETGLNPSWNTAIGNMAENYISLTGDVIIPCMQSMVDANGVYIQSLDAVQQAAGISFSNVASGIDYAIQYTQALIQDNGTLVSTYNEEINAVNQVCQAIANLVGQYSSAEAAAIDAANAALKYWAAVQGHTIGNTYSGGTHNYTPSTQQVATVSPTTGDKTSNSSSSSGKTNSGTGSGTKKNTGTVSGTKKNTGTVSNITYYDQDGKAHSLSTSNSNASSGYKFSYIGSMGGDNYQYIIKAKNKDGTYSDVGYTYTDRWKKETYSYDTGGYTGEWNNGSKDGRLAFLHQKELVLNEKDTKNTLSAVKIASNIISSVAGLGSSALQNLVAGRNISKTLFGNNSDNSTSQNITINAEFPNASSSQEIEQAFNNLVNSASQRANQNRRKY